MRRAASADAAAIAELLGVLGYPSSEEQVRGRLERFERTPGAEVLVAEREGTVVGVVGVSQNQLLAHAPACRVTALAVAQEARRAGAGTALMNAVEGLAREQGCFRVEVTCRPDRDAAHALYRSRGYEERRHRFAKGSASRGAPPRSGPCHQASARVGRGVRRA